jgi:diaminohydroxyphosphoribosylaminopyrimidine deaminase/5-amino-6-(5-phosphoribosylamino)uracil reductase
MAGEKKFMKEALRLAARGRGHVEPNPMVGAVIVRGGRVIGRGWHRKFGGRHAEVEALDSCANPKGADMFVTLEPCSRYGKTPPCTGAIVKAGLKRVVVACKDPTEGQKGKGLQALRRAGIEVETGLLEEEAQLLNAPFFKRTTTGLPYVTVKWAMSLDGKIATALGESAWISSEASRRVVHSLRGEMDAVLVGVNTVIRDDPLLTARHVRAKRTSARVVLDSMARTPLDSTLVQTASSVDTLIVVSPDAPKARTAALEKAGCAILPVRTRRKGFIELVDLLEFLGRRHFTNVLIEGGGEVIASAFEDRVVDRVLAFIAPKVIGGRKAVSPVEGVGVGKIRQAVTLTRTKVHRIGDDTLLEGLVQYPD